MRIDQFFNESNVEHLRAYRHLSKTGIWPEGFLPEDIEFFPSWQMALMAKMAECWISLVLADLELLLDEDF